MMDSGSGCAMGMRRRALGSWQRRIGCWAVPVLMVGCNSGGTASEAPSAETAVASEKVAAVPLPDGEPGVLEGYERLRSQFAQDSFTGVSGTAAALAEAAEQADSSSADGAGRWAAVSEAAAALSKAAEKGAQADGAMLRKRFGELSETLIGILRKTPELQSGLHLYECPMAEGYGLWVQTQEQLANPYMGQKMLHCGASREF